MLVIIGGFAFGLDALFFLSFFFILLFIFLIIFKIFIFITLFYFFFLSFFFSPFFLSCVADRVFLLWLVIRPVPLRWESRVQDIGPPGTSQLHITSNGESSPRDLHLNTKTQLHSMISKLQYWTPYAKQLARQEHNLTH